MARQLKPCGTVAAFQRHKRHRETPCEACTKAMADYLRAYWKTYVKPNPKRKAVW